MGSRKLFFAVVFLCASAFAQNNLVPVPPVFLGPSTSPRLGANLTITFCTSVATGAPCSPLAQAYADSSNSNPINQTINPLKTDALGNPPAFYAAPGQYSFTVSGPGIGAPQGPYQITVSCIPGSTCVAMNVPNSGNIIVNPAANGVDVFSSTRFTDTLPTGNFVNFKSLAGVTLFKIDINGNITTAGAVNAQSYNNKQTVNSATAGADMCAKIATGVAALPSTGGIVDATFFQGTQACASNPFSGVTSPLKLILGHATVQPSVQWLIASGSVDIQGMGRGQTVIQYTGSAIAAFVKVSSATPTTVFVQNFRMSDMTIKGSANVTDTVLLMGTHRSSLARLDIKDATGACLHTQFAVVDDYQDIGCTSQTGVFAQQPANGLLFDQIDASHATTASTVTNPIVEGVSGSGIKIVGGNGLVFNGGTSELNNRGVEVTSGTNNYHNTFNGLDMEANTVEDVLDNAGSPGTDRYENVLSSTAAANSIHFGSTAVNSSVQGGTVNGVTIDAGALGINLDDFAYGNGGGTITDNGTNTHISRVAAIAAGTKILGQPWTFRETTPPANLPSFGVTDPQDTLIANYTFTTVATIISNSVVTASKPWRVIFIGLWMNNVEGGGLAQPPFIIEATTASPSFTIGSVTVTVGLNASNQFTVTTGANAAGFSGRIFTTSNNQNTAGTASAQFKGSVEEPQLNVVEGTAPSGVASKDVCYGDSTAHVVKCSYNNAGFLNIPQVIASSTAAMTTGAINSLTCGSTVTVAATGVATTDTITWAFNAAPAANPAELVVSAWPTSGNVNFQYCNPTAGTVTPNAATLNWRVVR